MVLLNKIYGLVQAGRCLLNIFYDERFDNQRRIHECSASSMMERLRWR